MRLAAAALTVWLPMDRRGPSTAMASARTSLEVDARTLNDV